MHRFFLDEIRWILGNVRPFDILQNGDIFKFAMAYFQFRQFQTIVLI